MVRELVFYAFVAETIPSIGKESAFSVCECQSQVLIFLLDSSANHLVLICLYFHIACWASQQDCCEQSCFLVFYFGILIQNTRLSVVSCLSLNCFHLVIVLYLLAFELFVSPLPQFHHPLCPRQGYQLGSLIQGVLSVYFVPVPGVFVMACVA